MKKLLLLLITITLSSISYSQNVNIDSLTNGITNKWHELGTVDDFGDVDSSLSVIYNITKYTKDMAYLYVFKEHLMLDFYTTKDSEAYLKNKGGKLNYQGEEYTLKLKLPDNTIKEYIIKPNKEGSFIINFIDPKEILFYQNLLAVDIIEHDYKNEPLKFAFYYKDELVHSFEFGKSDK